MTDFQSRIAETDVNLLDILILAQHSRRNLVGHNLRLDKIALLPVAQPLFDLADDILPDEIKEVVEAMDTPCAPLLLKFYWEGYSMDEIAIQLGYANANSAKTQKNKCMNKLKAIFKSL